MKIQGMVLTNAMRKYRKNLSMTLTLLLLASSIPAKGGTSLATSPSMTSAAEGKSFVYVVSGVNSFGNKSSGGDFWGQSHIFNFKIPDGVDVGGKAHIMVQAKGVGTGCNGFLINDKQNNVLLNRFNSDEWHTEYNDIAPGGLHNGNNTLQVVSRNKDCGVDGLGDALDDFAITNVVIFFQAE
jgi:hypothetical protein